MSKPRILIVANFIPPISGGAEQVAWESARRLTKDYDVNYLALGTKKNYVQDGVKITLLPFKSRTFFYYLSFGKKELESFFSGKKFDLIHFHSATPWPFLCRNFLKEAKIIITCHGSDTFPNKFFLRQLILRRSLGLANKIFTPSKWLGNFIEYHHNFNTVLLPNGVETKKFFPIKSVSKFPRSVLFVGRKVTRKGYQHLLNISSRNKDINFYFAGSDFKPEDGKQPSNVNYVGFVDDLNLLFNQCSVCVFPSYWENHPVVGLEAMSTGSAIIATNLGFSEYIDSGKNGFIIENNSPKYPSIEIQDKKSFELKLEEKIRMLVENKDLKSKLSSNAIKAAKEYDWNIIMNSYRKELSELLKNK